MPSAAAKSTSGIAGYLASEEISEVRHEYIGGELCAMTGASDRYGLITLNIATALRPRVRGRSCQLFVSDMKLRLQVDGQDIFYYPDLLLSSEPSDREAHFRRAPCLLVEVTSESTTRIDRREKALAYQTILIECFGCRTPGFTEDVCYTRRATSNHRACPTEDGSDRGSLRFAA